jgi:hypothetical protein
MNLLVRRHQRAGLIGRPVFVLDVRAELTAEERHTIAIYGLGETILYSRAELVDPGAGLLGLASRLMFRMINISVSIDQLVRGKRIECTSIVEMLAVEHKIRSAFIMLDTVLEAAQQFAGEELVEP